MKCSHAQDQLVELFDAGTSVEPGGPLKDHLQTCPRCDEEFKKLTKLAGVLRPSATLAARAGFTEAVMNEIATIKASTKPVLYRTTARRYLLAAVAALVLMTAGTVAWRMSHGGRADNPAFALLSEAAYAMSNLDSVHIAARMRTLPGDNFELILLDSDFCPVDIWKQFGNPQRWRVEKPGRVAVMDGQSTVLWIKPDWAARGGQDAGFVEWFKTLMNVEQVLDQEMNLAKEQGSVVSLAHEPGQDGAQELVLSVEAAAQGDYTHDWCRNTSIADSDNLRVYRLDPETKRLKSLQIYVHAPQGDVLVFETTAVTCNEQQSDELYALALPDDVVWREQPKPLPNNEHYAQMTPRETAQAFFTACARSDWEEVATFLSQSRVPDKTKAYLGGVELLSLGEPFQSGLYPCWFVPYEIKLHSGETKKFNLAVRNDNPAHRYVVDGGI